MEREVDPVSPALQVFQVRKVQGTNLGKIYAMKVLRKVSHLLSQQIVTEWLLFPMHYTRLWEDSSKHDGGDGRCLGHFCLLSIVIIVMLCLTVASFLRNAL